MGLKPSAPNQLKGLLKDGLLSPVFGVSDSVDLDRAGDSHFLSFLVMVTQLVKDTGL